MKAAWFNPVLILVCILNGTFAFGTGNHTQSNDNQHKSLLDFEFYSSFMIADYALQRSIDFVFPNHYGSEDFEKQIQFKASIEKQLEEKSDDLSDSLLILSATYTYNSLYDAAYRTASIACEYQSEDKNILLIARQLAYITSYKTMQYDNSVKHLKELIQLASELDEQEVMISALLHLSYVYYSLNDLSMARLYFSTGLAEAKKAGKQTALITALEILFNNEGNMPYTVRYNQKKADSIANNSPVSEAGFYFLNLYKLSADAENKAVIRQNLFTFATYNLLNALQIEAGRLSLSDNSLSGSSASKVFMNASWLLQKELQVLNNRHQQFNHEIKYQKSISDQHADTSSVLSLNDQKIWLLFLIVGLLISVLLLFRIKRTKQDILNRRAQNDRNIVELNARAKTMDTNIDQRVAERNQVMMEELKEREKVDAELKIALKKAEDANYLKNSFLSSISHEIRTPLNGIMGFSNLLQQEMAELENTELYEYAHSIERSGERLLHLLNNIIDISRIEANDMVMTIKPLNIEEIINQIVDIFSFRANEKGIRIVVDGKTETSSLADKETLMRVLMEVMDNALKYTDKGFIKIEYHNDIAAAQQLIVVKDTGIGIDESYLPHIFDAFRQESFGYTRQYQGAGLGMPLAQRMMALMNGTIQVSSVKSSGTTVSIRIPLAVQSQVVSDIPNQTSKALPGDTNRRILVVEDDKSSRLIIGRMLKEYGVVELVNDGESAIQTLTAHKESGQLFDVVFLDINLPAPWDGIKLKNHIIKLLPEYKDVPFIAQTAYAMAGDKDRFFDAGFRHYIPKPIDKQILDRIMT